jgi:hypothetical protein
MFRQLRPSCSLQIFARIDREYQAERIWNRWYPTSATAETATATAILVSTALITAIAEAEAMIV